MKNLYRFPFLNYKHVYMLVSFFCSSHATILNHIEQLLAQHNCFTPETCKTQLAQHFT